MIFGGYCKISKRYNFFSFAKILMRSDKQCRGSSKHRTTVSWIFLGHKRGHKMFVLSSEYPDIESRRLILLIQGAINNSALWKIPSPETSSKPSVFASAHYKRRGNWFKNEFPPHIPPTTGVYKVINWFTRSTNCTTFK